MTILMMTTLAVALVSATVRPTITTSQVLTKVSPAMNRTSREFRVEPVIENFTSSADSPELRMADRKLSSDDDYRTLSSTNSDTIVKASVAAATGPKVYPSLASGRAGFVTRDRYIRNPFGSFSKKIQEIEPEDDQNADFMFNDGSNGGMSKWNRYEIRVIIIQMVIFQLINLLFVKQQLIFIKISNYWKI